MGTIYLSQHGTKVNLERGKFVISLRGETLQSVPELYVDDIVVMATVQLTHAVIMNLLRRGGTVTYMSPYGELQGIIGLDVQQGRQVLAQAAAHLDGQRHLAVARLLLQHKLKAQRQLLQRYNKSLHSDEVAAAVCSLGRFLAQTESCQSVNSLLGVEGMAAKEYYDCFPYLLKNSSFSWNGRNRRPPRDPVNALLSFAYTLLEREVKLMVLQSGLTTSIGFLHGVNDYKDGFVYDVMESFRSTAAERFVFRCINKKIVHPDGFDIAGDACYLGKTARRHFVSAFEAFINGTSFDGTTLHEAIRAELLCIRKCLRGDCEDEEECVNDDKPDTAYGENHKK